MICPSRQEADKAVNACHNKKTLPGVSGIWMFKLPIINNFYFSLSLSSQCLFCFVFYVFSFFLSIMLINAIDRCDRLGLVRNCCYQ